MQRVNSYLHSRDQPPYVLNLDPAVIHLPFEANIDIRDTVDYAEVMKQYNLGPNGGIMTALNLFTTKFDQVLGHVEKRANEVECATPPPLGSPFSERLTAPYNSQLRIVGHARADRDLYLVRVRLHHHRRPRERTPDRRRLHHRHAPHHRPRHFHEQHALCLLVRLGSTTRRNFGDPARRPEPQVLESED